MREHADYTAPVRQHLKLDRRYRSGCYLPKRSTSSNGDMCGLSDVWTINHFVHAGSSGEATNKTKTAAAVTTTRGPLDRSGKACAGRTYSEQEAGGWAVRSVAGTDMIGGTEQTDRHRPIGLPRPSNGISTYLSVGRSMLLVEHVQSRSVVLFL